MMPTMMTIMTKLAAGFFRMNEFRYTHSSRCELLPSDRLVPTESLRGECEVAEKNNPAGGFDVLGYRNVYRDRRERIE